MRQTLQRRNTVTLVEKGEQLIVCSHGLGRNQHKQQCISSHVQVQYQLVRFDHVSSRKTGLTAYHSNKYGSLAARYTANKNGRNRKTLAGSLVI